MGRAGNFPHSACARLYQSVRLSESANGRIDWTIRAFRAVWCERREAGAPALCSCRRIGCRCGHRASRPTAGRAATRTTRACAPSPSPTVRQPGRPLHAHVTHKSRHVNEHTRCRCCARRPPRTTVDGAARREGSRRPHVGGCGRAATTKRASKAGGTTKARRTASTASCASHPTAHVRPPQQPTAPLLCHLAALRRAIRAGLGSAIVACAGEPQSVTRRSAARRHARIELAGWCSVRRLPRRLPTAAIARRVPSATH